MTDTLLGGGADLRCYFCRRSRLSQSDALGYIKTPVLFYLDLAALRQGAGRTRETRVN